MLIALAVWDLTFWGGWLIDNQNFYLGAVNEVLHGRTILVDVFPQYGVGLLYALAAFFAVVHDRVRDVQPPARGDHRR